jgi:hypothetical protein
MPDTPGTLNFPTSLDTAVSLFETANNKWTTLQNLIDSSVTTVPVDSTSGFPDSGAISIGGEVIYYTGKTSTTFEGCLRGQDGTSASTHGAASTVAMLFVSAHHRTLANGLIEVETKLGSGSSVPTTVGHVLQTTGAGTSEWGELTGYAKLADSNEFALGQGIRAPLGSGADGLHVPWISGDTETTAYFGSADSGNNKVAVLGRSYSGQGLYGLSTTGTGVIAEAVGGAGLPLLATKSSVVSNIVALASVIRHTTSATPVAGFGVRQALQMQSSIGTMRDAGYIDASWSDATDATRTSALVFQTAAAGTMGERLRLNSAGATVSGTLTATSLSVSGNGTVVGALYANALAANSTFGFNGGTGPFFEKSGGDKLRLRGGNNASNIFSLIAFTSFTSSYPALKASGAGLQSRLADDSANSFFDASLYMVNGTQVVAGQQAAIADHPTDTTVNNILAALRTHGLIAP